MKTLGINRPTFDDPLYSQKNPHQTFLLVFSLYASAPLLFGGTSASRVLDQSVSPFWVHLWGALLLVGSTVGLAGEFWRGHTWLQLSIERAGLALVGLGGLFYSVVVYLTYGRRDHGQLALGLFALGAAFAVWGLRWYLAHPPDQRRYLTASVLTVAALVCGTVAASGGRAEAGVRYVVAITAAYALSCLWRCVQITRRLQWIRQIIDEVNRDAVASESAAADG